MNRSRLLSLGVVVALAAATAAGTLAYANSGEKNDAPPVDQAAISMVQAVTTAEQHVQGKATRAELEQTRQGLAYDIEVANGTQVFDVRVDAVKGGVLSSAKDTADHDDHDERD